MSSHRAGSLFTGLFVSVGAGALLGALGCASVLPPLTPPEAGGAAWRELVSKHVVLRTDRGEADAREALVELEQAYVALHEIGFPSVSIDGSRILVVHFDRERDYKKLMPPATAGVFMSRLPNDLFPEPTMVVRGKLDAAARGTFLHEITHMFVHKSLPGAPTWLNEGLAQYWETLAVEDGGAIVGRPIVERRAWAQTRWSSERVGVFMQLKVPVGSVPTVIDLTAMRPGEFYLWRADPKDPTLEEARRGTTNYLGAWGLVHMLLHDPVYQPRFDSMMEHMGKSVPAQRAWELAIAGVDAEEMETAYRQHMLNKFETMVLRTPYEHPEVAIEVSRVLPPAEVHVLWARLQPWRDPDLPAARADMEAALKLGEGSAEVSFWGGVFRARTGDLAAAEEAMQAAVAAQPKETRYLHGLAWLLRERALKEGASPESGRRADEAMARLAKVASSGSELNTLASNAMLLQRWDEALSFARRAVSADPACRFCFATLGKVLFAKKDYGAAVAAQQIAVSMVPDGARMPAEEAKLREYVEEARKQAEGTPAPEKAPAPEKKPGEAGAAEKAGAEGKPGAK